MWPSQVRIDHPRVVADLLGEPVGDLLPVVHGDDVVGNSHDEAHVVFDQ